MMTEAAIQQAPGRTNLDQYHVGGQRDRVVFGRRVQLRPTAARYGTEHAAAVEPEAAAVQPVEARTTYIERIECHVFKRLAVAERTPATTDK